MYTKDFVAMTLLVCDQTDRQTVIYIDDYTITYEHGNIYVDDGSEIVYKLKKCIPYVEDKTIRFISDNYYGVVTYELALEDILKIEIE